MTRMESDGLETGAAGRAALILTAHGERQVAEPNRLLGRHAEALRQRLAPMQVACGVLNGEPSLESALASITVPSLERLLVYPFFMAGGYFVERVLPERIAESGIGPAPLILPPLGLDPGLDELLMADALAAARDEGFKPEEVRLLVVGHGSKFGPASADATRAVAARLEAMHRFAGIETAFLEEAPFIAGALEAHGPVVVSGFFASEGMHSSRDVPEAIARSGAQAVYTGPVGAQPGVRDLIAAAVVRALQG